MGNIIVINIHIDNIYLHYIITSFLLYTTINETIYMVIHKYTNNMCVLHTAHMNLNIIIF